MDTKNLRLHSDGHDDFVAILTRQFEAEVAKIKSDSSLSPFERDAQVKLATREFEIKVKKARSGLF